MRVWYSMRMKLRENMGKSKTVGFSDVTVGGLNVRLEREPLDVVDCFKYLGSQVW